MPTWEEIEDAARHDPLLHKLVALDYRRAGSREELMISTLLAYSAVNADMTKRYSDLIAIMPAVHIVVPDESRFDRCPRCGLVQLPKTATALRSL